MSELYRLDKNDVVKGGLVVVLVAVFASLQEMFTAHGLDFAAFDWGWILNCAALAFIGYLGKNLSTDSTGTTHTPFGKVKAR